jgi:hypothetical protein
MIPNQSLGRRSSPRFEIMVRVGVFVAAVLAAIVSASAAMADDWIATKLRGEVFVSVDGQWVALNRGDVISDDRAVRTADNGRVTFQRDGETIELMGGTEIQIVDESGRRYTTVRQAYGTVAIEAEVQNVQHFEVRSITMAAVVKGTRFVVVSDPEGTDVTVERGQVAVECLFTHFTSTVGIGQTAANGHGAHLHVLGEGDLPVVYDDKGNPT